MKIFSGSTTTSCEKSSKSIKIIEIVLRRELLKEKIHPVYKESAVVCACGESFTTKSTKPKIHVDICSKCHPFFTGKQKIVDAEGRVEKFKKKYAKSLSTRTDK
jgi:large subunit ribosomal protein L31